MCQRSSPQSNNPAAVASPNASSQPSPRARTRYLAGRGMPKGGSHPLMHRLAAPLRCSLVLSLRETEQSTYPAFFIRAASGSPGSASTLVQHRDSASAEAAKWLSDRPLETFGLLRLEERHKQREQRVASEQPAVTTPPQQQRCRSAGIPPPRRRPKDFPVALWKPSAPGWRTWVHNKNRSLCEGSERYGGVCS